ncbi:hypothetical protein AB0F72_27905 [Actinoplanes sp. NPDC023936]|uniref:hypothetical protein n=1 Tax=Actinoplanes sp. NPDC023936 TaxID=3154910 RepID=UPI0034021952
MRTFRTVLAASVLAATSVFFVDLATDPAYAATAPTVLTEQQRHLLTGYHVDRVVADGARHQRLYIADDVTHRILAVSYDGTVVDEVALPDGANASDLRLSADSFTLWAIVPDAHLIISWNADTLEENQRYPVTASDLGHLTLAANKVWFTYSKNYFASLDPATGEITGSVIGAGTNTSGSARQPLIAASPTDPNRLAVTDADTRGDLFLYDVSGAKPELIAESQTGLTYGHSALAYTADGSMIYVAGVGGVYYTWADDLAPTQGRVIPASRAVDVEAASGGWIAAGLEPSADSTDLRLYKPAESATAREFDFPISGATPSLTGIEWDLSADRLFAITTDPAGAQSLWTIENPTVTPTPPASSTPTSITLKGPVSTTRGSAVAISGRLNGTGPMDAKLKVTRTDAESPSGVAVPSVNSTWEGDFTFLDYPPAGGTVTYTVTYAGDATHKPSSAKVSVTVSKTTPVLTLNRNGSVNAYGATVSMTAKLGATYKNRTVEIWADPYGSDQPRRLIKKGVVTSAGTLSVNHRLTRNTTFSAVFTGDTRYAARTVTSALKTKVAVSTAVTKHYKVASSYYYVRKAKNPKFTTAMTAYPKRKQTLVFEQYSGGKWKAWKSGTFTLSSAGTYTYTLTGTHKTGVKYRVRAVYTTGTAGDSANYTTYGSWKYFRFTK